MPPRRRLLLLAVTALVSPASFGCGTGSPIQEGIPSDVDLTKEYKPEAAVGNMSPKDALKRAPKKAKGSK